MTDRPTDGGDPTPGADKSVGKGEGGADSSGPGNILAGVQPEADGDRDETERRDD